MDLTTTRQTVTTSRPWLLGHVGVDEAISVALDPALFDPVDPRWSSGQLPSGLIIAPVLGGADAKYGPWDPEATDGRQYAAGVLLNTCTLNRAPSGLPDVPSPSGINRTSVAMMTRGTVIHEELAALNPGLLTATTPLWANPTAGALMISTALDGQLQFAGLHGFRFVKRTQGV